MNQNQCNYQNGKIYKLVNDVNDDIYIGSTATSLANRKYWHKHTQMPKVKIMYDVIGWDKLKIILVEGYPCDDNDQLRQRERYWYDELKPALNTRRPWISEEERVEYSSGRDMTDYHRQYVKDNYEHIKQYQKQYRIDNPAKFKEKYGKKINCDCGSSMGLGSLYLHRKSKKHMVWKSVNDFIYD